MSRIQQAIHFSVLVIGALTLSLSECQAQVDPAWLASWQEAQQLRPDPLPIKGRIAPESEAGDAMLIRGRILEPGGTPAAGVVVHAYHRDSEGFEFGPPQEALTTWRLQGWAQTDSQGTFEFATIRPAADHMGREAAHIHFTLQSAAFGRQWAPKIFFSGDPLVTAAQQTKSENAGRLGSVRTVKTVAGVQIVEVLFKLKDKPDF